VPGAVHLAGDEHLSVVGAVGVATACGAVARRRARYRTYARANELVEGGGAGHLDGRVPGAVHLAGDERLVAAGAVGVATACGAVARRRARHRTDLRAPALVEGGGAGPLDGRVPCAVRFAGDERLVAVGGVGVDPACGAVPRGSA